MKNADAFDAEIKKVLNIKGTYITMPLDIRQEFSKGRLKAHPTFDGEFDGTSSTWASSMPTGTPALSLAYERIFAAKLASKRATGLR